MASRILARRRFAPTFLTNIAWILYLHLSYLSSKWKRISQWKEVLLRVYITSPGFKRRIVPVQTMPATVMPSKPRSCLLFITVIINTNAYMDLRVSNKREGQKGAFILITFTPSVMFIILKTIIKIGMKPEHMKVNLYIYFVFCKFIYLLCFFTTKQ